jgi:hypothetical protein
MAVEELTAIDGQAVGVGQTVRLYIPAGSAYGLSAKSEWHERAGIGSTFHGQTPAPREINLIAIPGTAAAGLSINAWHGAAQALLRPSGGLRTLTATLDGSPVSIEAAIENVEVQEGLPVASATAYAPSQFWRSTTTQTDTTSTTTNGGNAPASPKITFNPTVGTVLRRRVTLTELTGRGLVNHPLRITVDTTGASVAAGSDILIFDRGQSVPFQAQGVGTSTTKIDFLCNLLPSEVGFIDIVYGSVVTNTLLANTLDPAGFDWANASFSNTNWIYLKAPTTLNGIYAPSIFETARAPRRPGAWHRIMYNPAIAGAWVETITAGSESISLNGGAGITAVTQIKTGTSNAITGMGIDAASSATNSLHYRKAGEWDWRQGTVATTGSVGSPKELTTMDADDAVQLAITSNLSTSTDVFNQFDTDPIVVLLQSGEVPTISVGAAVTMNRGNGTLTNSTTGDTITLEELYWDDDGTNGLIIDTNAAAGERLRVYPSLSTSPLYTASTGRGWRFSNRAGWPLTPGANTWAWSGDGSPTITLAWQDTYAV